MEGPLGVAILLIVRPLCFFASGFGFVSFEYLPLALFEHGNQ